MSLILREGGQDVVTAPLSRLLDPESINHELLQGWLDTCRHCHGLECTLEDHIPLPALKFINVNTRQLEEAQASWRYAALSYVWGDQQTQTPLHLFSLSEVDFPLTILDAIDLCKRLNIGYLWVDRYCIDGRDERVKLDQIRKMDVIYRQADFTIIAAAGYNPNYGLPGISRVPRHCRPLATVGNYILQEECEQPKWVVERSTWASRAWTYQEGICSRRRLVFTDKEVTFECAESHCRETSYNITTRWEYLLFGRRDIPQRAQVYTHIQEYTQREMSRQSDALNALLGVLHKLQDHDDEPIYHLCGVPIFLVDNNTLSQSFLLGLNWWFRENPRGRNVKRRNDFPSWSWTGWDGAISYFSNMLEVINRLDSEIDPACQVSLLTSNDSWMNLNDANNIFRTQSSLEYSQRSLRLEAFTVAISFGFFRPDPQHEMAKPEPQWLAWACSQTELAGCSDHRLAFPLELYCEVSPSSALLAISFTEIEVSEELRMVVISSDGETAQRVGHLEAFSLGGYLANLKRMEYQDLESDGDMINEWSAGSSLFTQVVLQ